MSLLTPCEGRGKKRLQKPLLGRLTYQETMKVLNVTDRQLTEYIKAKRLIPKTTIYSEGPFFDIVEIRKILNIDRGVDLLPEQIMHVLLPPELEKVADDNSQLLSLQDILLKYGFKKDVILQWLKQGKLKAYTKNMKTHIRTSDLEELFIQNMNEEKKKAIETTLVKAETIEEKMGLVVHRVKTLYFNAMTRVGKELQECKTISKNIELAWFRVEKCHQECILGKKDLCSHYYAETTELGMSPCIKQVTIKKELMEDLKQRFLKKDITVTPTASVYIEIVSDAMVDYIFGRMLVQEMRGMPSEDKESGSLKMIMAISSSARKEREHIAELLVQFGDYIKQLQPKENVPPPEDVLQKFWAEKMEGD